METLSSKPSERENNSLENQSNGWDELSQNAEPWPEHLQKAEAKKQAEHPETTSFNVLSEEEKQSFLKAKAEEAKALGDDDSMRYWQANLRMRQERQQELQNDPNSTPTENPEREE